MVYPVSALKVSTIPIRVPQYAGFTAKLWRYRFFVSSILPEYFRVIIRRFEFHDAFPE